MRKDLAGRLFLLAGAGLLPWIGVLWATLPDAYPAQHWRVAWVGLDLLEALGLLATAWLVRRGDHRAPLASIGTAVLLFVDAWFDVLTAGSDVVVSLIMALALELPLAAVCVFVALRKTAPAVVSRATRPLAVAHA
ncbi:hypothetical protein ACFWY9_26740 [Amycolatopsis sp. NPDC059027]|uniref:hypothetical protein n=1 Tax=unclassified Amycolatopsis TaxID=2618356 RepID=UPI00366C70FF